MADTPTTTSVLDNLLKHYFVPVALKTLEAETPLYDLAQKDDQPRGSGNTTYWNAWVKLAGASSAITEGTANSLVALSSRRVSATIAQYGRGVKITDLADFMSVLDPMGGGRQRLMDSAKSTLEYVCHMGIYKNSISKNRTATSNLSSYVSGNVSGISAVTGTHNGDIQFQFPGLYPASTTRLSAVSGSAPSTSAQLSVYSLRRANLHLASRDAMPFPDGYYVAYCHPSAAYTLRKDPAFIQWNAYQNSRATMWKGETGSVENFRIVTSTLAPRYRVTARSINMVFCTGAQSFGVTSVLGRLNFYTTSGPDKTDPFNQYSTLTYKISAAAACLNPSAGVIVFCHEKR